MVQEYCIRGTKKPLSGEVEISGGKMSAQALLPSAILTGKNGLTLSNSPSLDDVLITENILRGLGFQVSRDNGNVTVIGEHSTTTLPSEISQKVRHSVLFAGPMLGKYGEVTICTPGGCSIGSRPIDYHLKGFKDLGAVVDSSDGSITIKGKLKGNKVNGRKSVGTTINLLYAALFADGETVIENAAFEPEICDLVGYLNHGGAPVKWNQGSLEVKGNPNFELRNNETHRVIPDRIEAVTFMTAAYLTKGHLTLKNVDTGYLHQVMKFFNDIGAVVNDYKTQLEIKTDGKKKEADMSVSCGPFPMMPTDYQPFIVLSLADTKGFNTVREYIWPDRLSWVDELNKMGCHPKDSTMPSISFARLPYPGGNPYSNLSHYTAFTISGPTCYTGSDVVATDIRGGAALVLAALRAEGKTIVTNVGQIERGYDGLVEKLNSVGARITKK